MKLTNREWALAMVFIAFVGVAAAATVSTTPISNNDDGIILNQPDGPTANLTGNTDLKNSSGGVDNDTIQFNTTDGSARFTSSGPTYVEIAVSDLEGAWTNGTNINATQSDLTIAPGDKRAVTVGGDVDSIAFRDATVDDESVDFAYSGSGGRSTVTISGVAASTEIGAVSSGGQVLDSSTSDASGEVTFSLPSGSYDIELHTNQGSPGTTAIEPTDGYKTNQEDVTFSVNVSDPDFPEDNVSATLYRKGPTESSFSQIYQDSLSTAGQVSTTQSLTIGGEHEYYWILEDGYGATTQTNTRTVSVPDTLYIYDIEDPNTPLSTSGTIDITLASDDQVFERSTDDGTVSLTGLPVTGIITAQASVDGYYDRQTVIRSIFEQQGLYLLNDNRSAYQTRFTLTDNTGGRFSDNNPTVDVQRALNKSGSTKWVSVGGGRFGVQGYTTNLQAGSEYRLVVRNDQGDSRTFYPFTAAAAEEVPLEIGSIEASVTGDESYVVETFYQNSTSGTFVELELNDPTDSTETVWVEIYERGNESNVLLENTSFTGPYGNLSVKEQVPQKYNQTSWVIEYRIDRGETTETGREIVGPQQPVLTNLPWWLRTIISIGVIWIVAGLFSQINGPIGGIVCAGLGGMFWFVGFLPQGVGVGVVILSMITAAMLFVQSRRAA